MWIFQKIGLWACVLAAMILASIDPASLMTAAAAVLAGMAGLVQAVEHFLRYLDSRRNSGTGDAGVKLPGLAVAAGVVVALLAGGTVLSGCSATPKQRLLLARQSYTAALNVASDLRQAGVVPDDAARKIEAARVVAAGLLDQIETTLNAGGDVSSATWQALSAAIDLYTAEVNAAKGTTSNVPSGNSGVSEGGGGRGPVLGFSGSYAFDGRPRPNARRDRGREVVASCGGSPLGRVAA